MKLQKILRILVNCIGCFIIGKSIGNLIMGQNHLIDNIILIVVGVGICISVAIFNNQDVEVRIERAGVCNPLKPVKDKEVKTDDDTKKKLAKYWKKTDKDVEPKANEIVDSLVGDYKLFVGEDEILFNLDLNYVSYNIFHK